MFTAQEAVSFLQSKWEVERVEERFHDTSARKCLLEEVIKLIQAKVPFQSITLMATKPEERTRPSVNTIKEECMAGVGGLCYNINVFTWGLLKGLGFSAQLCSATCTSTVTSPGNHVIVLINDLEKKGDLHLVECGLGFPTFRVIDLNFEHESPVYVDSFLEYKYIHHEEKILRMHGKGDMIKRNNPPVEDLDFFIGDWRRFYSFALKPSDNLSDFDDAFDQVFTVPRTTPFDHSPRALAFSDQHAVILVNNRLMLENESGKLETTVLDDDEAIIASYRLHFPFLKEDVVRRAISQWHLVQK